MGVFGAIGFVVVAILAIIVIAGYLIYKKISAAASWVTPECTTAADCAVTEYCGGVPVQCRPRLGSLGFCLADNYCVSNHCTNGQCADTDGKLPEGALCAAGSGHCKDDLVCQGTRCVKKGKTGEYCNGVAAGEECESGVCNSLSQCMGPDGKVPEGGRCASGSNHCTAGTFCDGSKCVGLRKTGEYCNGIAAGAECESGVCNSLSQCMGPDGKVPEGGRCASGSNHCTAGTFCDGSKCVGLRKTGEYCNGIAAGAECESGVCNSLSQCMGPGGKVPEGGRCAEGSGHCASGLYCKVDRCVGPAKEGESCIGGQSQCGPGLMCGPGSTCVKKGTSENWCSTDWGCLSSDCGSNLKCQYNFCSSRGDPSTYGGVCYDWDNDGKPWHYLFYGKGCKDSNQLPAGEIQVPVENGVEKWERAWRRC